MRSRKNVDYLKKFCLKTVSERSPRMITFLERCFCLSCLRSALIRHQKRSVTLEFSTSEV